MTRQEPGRIALAEDDEFAGAQLQQCRLGDRREAARVDVRKDTRLEADVIGGTHHVRAIRGFRLQGELGRELGRIGRDAVEAGKAAECAKSRTGMHDPPPFRVLRDPSI